MVEGVEIKVEIIKRETIKPSYPTPPHLKSFKLSVIDQITPNMYTSLVLFYPKSNDLTTDQTAHLKKSLSEALTLFYPLAGRVKDNKTIECHDEGAQYIEAKFNGLLSNFLEENNDEALTKQFVPAETESPEAGTWPLLLVQATFFDCRGVAIGVCVSHKLADACTLSIFLKTWARSVVPDFAGVSHFCPGDNLSFTPPVSIELKMVEGVAKRFVLDKSKIAALKARSSSDIVKQPTKVEVVTALISRSLMGASPSSSKSSASSVKPRYTILLHGINIRKRVEPPFSENSAGNLIAIFLLEAENDSFESISSTKPLEIQLQYLVAKFRNEIKEFSENKVKSFQGDERFKAVVENFKEGLELRTRDDVHLVYSTSWCNFGFYEVDLGFGNPIYVTIPSNAFENLVMLMDTKYSDGVEVLVTLSKENMILFEKQLGNILSFASSS